MKKPRKIRDRERLEGILYAVDQAASHGQSTNPQRDWKESHRAVCAIYRMVHTVLSPECRKNHPDWTNELDAAIRAGQRGKA